MTALPLLKTHPYRNAPCGYVIIGKKSFITAINNTGLKWLEYTEKQLINKIKFDTLLTEQGQALFHEKTKDVPIELELIKKNGEFLNVIAYDMGNMLLLVNSTEQKRLKTQLCRANEQLFNLQQEKEYFIGIASHDLKQPLSVIVLLSDTLLAKQNGTLNKCQEKIIGLMHEASSEMMQLIQNYLTASRFGAGKITLKLTETNITKLTRNIVARYKEISRKKDIMLHITSDADHYLQTDPDYYSRIMENLISNAIKYTMPGKNVCVRLTNENDFVHITVKDEGVGIRKKDIPLLFEKFQNLSSKPTGGELSTGLGLNIVKFLLDQLHGTIQVTSQWGKGSCFTISFCKELIQ